MDVKVKQVPSCYPVKVDATSDIRDKLPYSEYLIDSSINKAVRVEIVSVKVDPFNDGGPMTVFVKGREKPYRYASYDEFIKEWGIPPIDSSCPEDEEWIKELFS